MRVQTEEWRQFVPGVRMYKGKKTLFYNGESLFDYDNNDEEVRFLIYDREERDSWEVIIVLPGVEVIPHHTFQFCPEVKEVVMNDEVLCIDPWAFFCCEKLLFVQLSKNLEFMGDGAFCGCSLTSMFIPPSCTEIHGTNTFACCRDLIILNIPQQAQLEECVIEDTALIRASPFELYGRGKYDNHDEVNQWVKNINSGREYSLHRLCCSTYENEALPISEAIYEAIKEGGLKVLQAKNKIGITPLKYLEENPYLENIDEMKLLKRFVLEMMG